MAKSKKSIKGTQTEKNLVIAYLAESSAYTRYNFYAQQADKEEYFPIGEVFRDTADNEMRHAKVYFKFLEGGSVNVPMDADAGVIADTASNLATAAEEELTEGVKLYTSGALPLDSRNRAAPPRPLRPLPGAGQGRHCVEARKTHKVAVSRMRICV